MKTFVFLVPAKTYLNQTCYCFSGALLVTGIFLLRCIFVSGLENDDFTRDKRQIQFPDPQRESDPGKHMLLRIAESKKLKVNLKKISCLKCPLPMSLATLLRLSALPERIGVVGSTRAPSSAQTNSVPVNMRSALRRHRIRNRRRKSPAHWGKYFV